MENPVNVRAVGARQNSTPPPTAGISRCALSGEGGGAAFLPVALGSPHGGSKVIYKSTARWGNRELVLLGAGQGSWVREKEQMWGQTASCAPNELGELR